MNPSTREECIFLLTHQRPLTVLQQIQTTDILQAIHSPWPELQMLNEKTAIDYLAAAIAITSRMLNCVQKMEGDCVRITAGYLMEDYRHLNIEDVMLCLKMGVKEQLAEFHGRFDAQVVYNWFYQYNIQRDQATRLDELRRSL